MHHEVTSSDSITELKEFLKSQDVDNPSLGTREINIGPIQTNVEIFPEYWFFVNGNATRRRGKNRGVSKNTATAEQYLRQKRIIIAADDANYGHSAAWKIKIAKGLYFLITVDQEGDFDSWHFVIKKYMKPSKISAENTVEWVEIKPSTIPGAGRGVFATRDIPAGKIMGHYVGHIVTMSEMSKNNSDKLMTISIKPPWWPKDVKFRKKATIDGEQGGNWTCMINDFRGTGKKMNITYNNAGMFYTVLDIAKGEEFFTDYGEAYWRGKTPGKTIIERDG